LVLPGGSSWNTLCLEAFEGRLNGAWSNPV